MKLYMLYVRKPDGTIGWKLGGGSSTPAAPRIYPSREQAERIRGRLRSGRNAEIHEIDIPDGE